MKTTKTVVLKVENEIKRLEVGFDYIPDENRKNVGKLWYYSHRDGEWQYWDMFGYENQDDAILGFCKENWGERFVGIE